MLLIFCDYDLMIIFYEKKRQNCCKFCHVIFPPDIEEFQNKNRNELEDKTDTEKEVDVSVDIFFTGIKCVVARRKRRLVAKLVIEIIDQQIIKGS